MYEFLKESDANVQQIKDTYFEMKKHEECLNVKDAKKAKLMMKKKIEKTTETYELNALLIEQLKEKQEEIKLSEDTMKEFKEISKTLTLAKKKLNKELLAVRKEESKIWMQEENNKNLENEILKHNLETSIILESQKNINDPFPCEQESELQNDSEPCIMLNNDVVLPENNSKEQQKQEEQNQEEQNQEEQKQEEQKQEEQKQNKYEDDILLTEEELKKEMMEKMQNQKLVDEMNARDFGKEFKQFAEIIENKKEYISFRKHVASGAISKNRLFEFKHVLIDNHVATNEQLYFFTHDYEQHGKAQCLTLTPIFDKITQKNIHAYDCFSGLNGELVFDIDVKCDKETYELTLVQENEVVTDAIKIIKMWLNVGHKTRIVVLQTHRKISDNEYKISYHIHFIDVYCENMQYIKNLLDDRMYSQHENILIRGIDRSIYSTDKNFRALNESKVESDCVLKPLLLFVDNEMFMYRKSNNTTMFFEKKNAIENNLLNIEHKRENQNVIDVFTEMQDEEIELKVALKLNQRMDRCETKPTIVSVHLTADEQNLSQRILSKIEHMKDIDDFFKNQIDIKYEKGDKYENIVYEQKRGNKHNEYKCKTCQEIHAKNRNKLVFSMKRNTLSEYCFLENMHYLIKKNFLDNYSIVIDEEEFYEVNEIEKKSMEIDEHIEEKMLTDDLVKEHKNFCLESPCGTGKTTAMLFYFKETKLTTKIIFVLNLVQSIENVECRFSGAGFKTYNYDKNGDCKEFQNNEDKCILFVTFYSLHKIPFNCFDTLVVDECESILNDIVSNANSTKTLDIFEYYCRNKIVVLMDELMDEYVIHNFKTASCYAINVTKHFQVDKKLEDDDNKVFIVTQNTVEQQHAMHELQQREQMLKFTSEDEDPEQQKDPEQEKEQEQENSDSESDCQEESNDDKKVEKKITKKEQQQVILKQIEDTPIKTLKTEIKQYNSKQVENMKKAINNSKQDIYEQFQHVMKEHIKTNEEGILEEKICIIVNERQQIKSVKEAFIDAEIDLDKNVVLECHGMETTKEKKQIARNIDELAKECNIFIFTQTIVYGVDIETPFDVLFYIQSEKLILENPQMISQQIFRTRNCKLRYVFCNNEKQRIISEYAKNTKDANTCRKEIYLDSFNEKYSVEQLLDKKFNSKNIFVINEIENMDVTTKKTQNLIDEHDKELIVNGKLHRQRYDFEYLQMYNDIFFLFCKHAKIDKKEFNNWKAELELELDENREREIRESLLQHFHDYMKLNKNNVHEYMLENHRETYDKFMDKLKTKVEEGKVDVKHINKNQKVLLENIFKKDILDHAKKELYITSTEAKKIIGEDSVLQYLKNYEELRVFNSVSINGKKLSNAYFYQFTQEELDQKIKDEKLDDKQQKSLLKYNLKQD